MDEAHARAWCEQMASGLDVQRIQRDGKPYLERYFACGWTPANAAKGPAVLLHHFVASDATDTVHSHPWGWSSSLILVGGYCEHRCRDGQSSVHYYRSGDVNVLMADDQHRIELLAPDCWTLFLAGSFQKAWTFTPTC